MVMLRCCSFRICVNVKANGVDAYGFVNVLVYFLEHFFKFSGCFFAYSVVLYACRLKTSDFTVRYDQDRNSPTPTITTHQDRRAVSILHDCIVSPHD